jgi:hypothetical protein
VIADYVMWGLIAAMPVIFIFAIRKVTAQRQKQIELLERIARAVETPPK